MAAANMSIAAACKAVTKFCPTGNLTSDTALFGDFGARLKALTPTDGSIRAAMEDRAADSPAEEDAADEARCQVLQQLLTLLTDGPAFALIKTGENGREMWQLLQRAYGNTTLAWAVLSKCGHTLS